MHGKKVQITHHRVLLGTLLELPTKYRASGRDQLRLGPSILASKRASQGLQTIDYARAMASISTSAPKGRAAT
jgi:hypothetical protein